METKTSKPLFKKVLVIDDNETDRYVANRMIQKHKFSDELVLKESAIKALAYLRSLESTPDLLPQFIFLDIRMPEMDGFEFLEEYSKLPENIKSNCVIMMLTTSLDPLDHSRAENNPFVNRFFSKPLTKESLQLLEEEYIAKKTA